MNDNNNNEGKPLRKDTPVSTFDSNSNETELNFLQAKSRLRLLRSCNTPICESSSPSLLMPLFDLAGDGSINGSLPNNTNDSAYQKELKSPIVGRKSSEYGRARAAERIQKYRHHQKKQQKQKLVVQRKKYLDENNKVKGNNSITEISVVSQLTMSPLSQTSQCCGNHFYKGNKHEHQKNSRIFVNTDATPSPELSAKNITSLMLSPSLTSILPTIKYSESCSYNNSLPPKEVRIAKTNDAIICLNKHTKINSSSIVSVAKNEKTTAMTKLFLVKSAHSRSFGFSYDKNTKIEKTSHIKQRRQSNIPKPKFRAKKYIVYKQS